ncbi:MAG: HDOD domain-containing protein [Thermodesulfobacteriota bacterium]
MMDQESDVFVARQPIFDRRQRVYGYELLYRARGEDNFCLIDGDQATLSVIRNVLLVHGPEKLTGGKKAFINFTKNLLLNKTPFYLPKEIAVVEILEGMEVDKELLEACRHLKENNYLLALDDFLWPEQEDHRLTELADLIKVDFRQSKEAERKTIVDHFRPRGLKLIAEKTETREEFQEALDSGFTFFQGFFFSKPVIISSRDIPGFKLTYLRVLKELARPELDFRVLEKIIARDPSLSYKMLKYINSAFFGLRYEITSIIDALRLLGEREIRRWASLAVLTHLGQDQPQELLRFSLLRARFCESLAPKVGLASQKSELFLMGMFSLMDVFIGRPLDEILDDIPLTEKVKAALLGHSNDYRTLFDLVVNYETAAWEQVSNLAEQLSLEMQELPVLYAESINWVDRPLWFSA